MRGGVAGSDQRACVSQRTLPELEGTLGKRCCPSKLRFTLSRNSASRTWESSILPGSVDAGIACLEAAGRARCCAPGGFTASLALQAPQPRLVEPTSSAGECRDVGLLVRLPLTELGRAPHDGKAAAGGLAETGRRTISYLPRRAPRGGVKAVSGRRSGSGPGGGGGAHVAQTPGHGVASMPLVLGDLLPAGGGAFGGMCGNSKPELPGRHGDT